MRAKNVSSRIFYYAPVANDRLNRLHDQHLDIPAARNKVVGVCAALAAAGYQATIVSSVVPGPILRMFLHEQRHDDGAVPLLVVPVIGRRVVKRISAAWALLLFTLRRVRNADRVILYNFYPEYVLAALALRLAGNPAFLDVEDGPIAEHRDAATRVTHVSYAMLDRLCSRRRLTVSHQLAQRMGYKVYMPIYGVADHFADERATPDRFFNDELHVVFGGNIMAGTGADLFESAVRRLAARHPDAPLHFHLSGHYDQDRFAALARELDGVGRVRLTLHGLMLAPDYRALAVASAVGLCLKLPSHSVGQTTFPSKVVEIATVGMLLVTMAVSDVPLVFSDDNAILLRSEDADELIAALLWAEANRHAAAKRAEAGRRIVKERLSSEAIGPALGQFLFV